MSIDLSNVIALALGSDDVLQIQDAIGTVLWQKIIYYNVNISAGSNGTVSVNGVSGDYSQSVPSGTVLTIEGTGNTGYDFEQWSDGVSTNPRTITVTDNLALTASFESSVVSDYFYVEDASGAQNTLTIVKNTSTAPSVRVYYSTDKTNWVNMGYTSTTAKTATIPANGRVYLKATTGAWGIRNNVDFYVNNIKCDANFNVGGNIMSLLYGDNFENQTVLTENYTFLKLFDTNSYSNNKIVDASNLILPATTLTNGCYYGMFADCGSLTTAPALPATTLANYCYDDMFFSCNNLNSVTIYAQDISATDCLENWLGNVSATGQFFNLGGATFPSGADGIPSGWTEHTSL